METRDEWDAETEYEILMMMKGKVIRFSELEKGDMKNLIQFAFLKEREFFSFSV